MKSNQEWMQWGKVDPLYAVASWKDRERSGSNPWTDEEFYAIGQIRLGGLLRAMATVWLRYAALYRNRLRGLTPYQIHRGHL